jgi:hypothetical protein
MAQQFIQSDNLDPTQAVFGEKSEGVRALQKQLNEQFNAGLSEDALYGPLTQAAYNKYMNQPAPTAENGFGAAGDESDSGSASPKFDFSSYVAPESEYETLAQSRYDTSQTPIDRDKIRQETRQQFQAQIDAINSVFDQLVADARVEGQGRLGSGRAIQARGGLLGSARGSAQTEQIKGFNREVISGINAKRNAAITGIFAKADELAQNEILDREKAAREGADSFLQHLQTKEERKRGNAEVIIDSLVADGIDINDMEQEQVFDLAGRLGVNPEDLITIYNGKVASATGDEDTTFELGQGQAKYRIDPETGEVERIAFNPKVFASDSKGGATSGSGLAEDFFTNSQLSKGAANAGMSVEEFGKLPQDEANRYIQGDRSSGEVNSYQDYGEDEVVDLLVKTNRSTAESLVNEIIDSGNLEVQDEDGNDIVITFTPEEVADFINKVQEKRGENFFSGRITRRPLREDELDLPEQQ